MGRSEVNVMSEKTIGVKAEIYLEHTCDFADEIMQMKCGNKYENYIEEENGGYKYTDEGQEIFDDILGEVEHFLGKFKIVNGSYYD